ncbi:peptide ABC transporter [Bradyrhizobium nanningense]|uniref:Peptide ABC transporter n=1 Tax=Bradyrhizobium nanningense TaxID=1325118 RepID=A0A4Q0S8V9_9BRAD|nr:peptide ABC transporter substrate-binding protein [Bradyrhizobium nanningense]RXH29739.1 peptide ABC transporter [Bradyrhizobium nanningense]
MSRLRSFLVVGGLAALVATPAVAGRGTDGTVNLLFWQAASTMNPYLANAPKELLPISLVLEPLAGVDPDGKLFPQLAAHIPTVENGGISKDLKSITWKLKPSLKWSDGSPVTAKDVVFTANYCMDPKGGCAELSDFQNVAKVEDIDDLTVKIIFDHPMGNLYVPFVNSGTPIVQAAQFANCLGEKAPTCTEANFNPIGTGPFVVTNFKPNDSIRLKANPNYRDPDKPHFAEVNIKGGGDVQTAALAVLQTGEYDYAWNLQLAPDVLKKMEKAGKGRLLVEFGAAVEGLRMNMTDPSSNLPPDERSTAKHANPILSDVRVRKALSMAIDRATLIMIGYAFMGRPTCDMIPAPAKFAAENTNCLAQDITGAKKLLDEAGWKLGPNGIREKDGKKLKLLFTTSTNAVRQQFQEMIKQWWREIGVDTELRNINASVFFSTDPGSPDTLYKFYADVTMFAPGGSIDPATYLTSRTCDKVPSPATQWQGTNITRYCDKNYDALVAELNGTANLEKRSEIVKKLNNILTVDSYVIVPLVWRGVATAVSNTLGGVVVNSWGAWNVQDWHRNK